MVVGEGHERVPVVDRHVVLAGAIVIADGAHGELVGRGCGHLARGETVCAQELEHGRGRERREEFAFRVGPEIFGGRADEDRPGAINAINSCWSTGRRSSRPLNWRKFVQNQWGKLVLMRRTVSPKLRLERRGPAAAWSRSR